MTSLARRLIAVALIASSLSGCTGYKRIGLGAVPPARSVIVSGMEVGESVRVEMRDGTRQKITIAKIEADALVGEKGERLAFAEIVSAERKGVDLRRTSWLIVGILPLVMLLLALNASPY